MDTQTPQPETITDSQGQSYCLIPATSFLAGEQNVRTRVPASFYLGRHLITRSEFSRFVEETDYQYGEIYRRRMEHISPRPNCPVTAISWWDAKYYVRWLRQVTGDYYSLPLEIEWELAARGPDGRLFPWGNAVPDEQLACCSTDFKRTTTDVVGNHPTGDSPYGCSDMVGNVWEYCLDDLDVDGEMHVVRGGSARSSIAECSSISRAFVSPSTLRVNYTGFRLLYLPGDMYDAYVAAQHQYVDGPPPPAASGDMLDATTG